MNFIARFLDWTSFAEGPEPYFRWAAISAIGAVMRDNIYHEWGVKGKLYPNLFILNVGPPAIGKQLPMRLSGELIRSVGNTTIIAGSASIQAVVRTLGTHETGQLKGASCILYSEELSSFYIKDQNTNELLTDLSDYHEVWERNLISWNAKLKNVCMSLFAASNEVLLKTVFDSAAIYGGLLSRTLLVVENKKRHKDPMTRKIVTNPQHEELLKNHLKCVSKLKGSIFMDDAALDEFDGWYKVWDESKDQTGTAGRMKTHIKKVAMCLCMADEAFELMIRKRHIEEAIELCIGLYKNYRILTMEAGKAITAHPTALILRALAQAKNYQLDERGLLRRFLGELNITILGEVIPNMEKAGLIIVTIVENETTYRLTPLALDLYRT